MGILSALIIGVVMTAINRPHPPPERTRRSGRHYSGLGLKRRNFATINQPQPYRIRIRARYDYLSNGAFRTQGELSAGEDIRVSRGRRFVSAFLSESGP